MPCKSPHVSTPMISMLSKTMPNNLASFSAVSYEKASLLQRVAIQASPFLFTQPGKIVSYMQVGQYTQRSTSTQEDSDQRGSRKFRWTASPIWTPENARRTNSRKPFTYAVVQSCLGVKLVVGKEQSLWFRHYRNIPKGEPLFSPLEAALDEQRGEPS